MAQYDDRRKEYGAAKVYYEAVRDRFKDTNLALESESRLAAISDYPSEPEQPVKWLAELFPEEQPAKPLLARDTPTNLRR